MEPKADAEYVKYCRLLNRDMDGICLHNCAACDLGIDTARYVLQQNS